jgi:hypothetical protein
MNGFTLEGGVAGSKALNIDTILRARAKKKLFNTSQSLYPRATDASVYS